MKGFLDKLRRQATPPPAAPQEAPAPDGFPELAAIAPYAMGLPVVLRKLHRLGQDVAARGIQGDFVECGVCNGGSAATIACALRERPGKIWLYDSFQGLPAPRTDKDGPEAAAATGACLGSEGKVLEALRHARFPEAQIVLKKGWFEQSFKEAPHPESIAILHLDCDWYESVLLSLRTFYDKVAEGGIIILDDFGHWEGCREAFYDFCAERRLRPLLERFGHTQAFWVKGRTHNRDFLGQWEIP